MSLTTNELYKAVRFALYAGVTAAVGLTATTVMAQDQGQGNEKLETIVVTGSRIRQADVETAQPIIVLDRAQIERQGLTSVADILQNLPEAGSPAISRADALSSGESVGGYFIDLRNLGASRTLILLNGKRLGADSNGLQDLGQVPTSAIERIEVLKDGASAIYGSDAISGVVNIITRTHYDGMEAKAYYGQYSQGDGVNNTYDFTMGTSTDRGSLTISTQYSKDDPVLAYDRKFSRYPNGPRHPTSGWSVASQYGNFFMPPGWCAGDFCSLNPGGDPFNPDDYHAVGAGGPTADRSNADEQMYLQTGTERHAFYLNGDYNITDNITFRTDILYNKRTTQQQIAGYPFQPAFALPFEGVEAPAIGLDPDSYYNPTGELVYFYRRGWEQPRRTRSDLQTYRYSASLEGNFDVGDHNWNWDVGGYVNTNDLLKVQRGDYSLIGLKGALGPSFRDPATGVVTCGTIDNPIDYGSTPGSCIPWNPFYGAGQVGEGSLTGNDALQAHLFPEYHDIGRTKTVNYAANITGSIFTLPAGDLAFAAGYEYRQESGRFVPDAMSQNAISTNLSAGPTGGRYSVNEYYVEVDVPVLKDLPFARELSFDIAGRYSKYSSFGNTTNGKFGLKWKPIDDLLVRGNYAQGFRAPTIGDLYGGLSGSFEFYTDPCSANAGSDAATIARCQAGIGGQPGTPVGYVQPGQGNVPCTTYPCQTGVQFLSGANPGLQPETSTSKTLGVVYSPGYVEGLDLTLDWYRIHIKGAISGDTVTDFLDDCYLRGDTARCSSNLFRRDPATGQINYALVGQTNKGYIDTEGYDFGVNYRLPETSFGRFMARWNTTYVSSLTSQSSPGIPVEVYTGLGANFRMRSNLSLDWTLGDFGATFSSRYYSSIKEKCSFDTKGGPECNQPDHVAPDTGPYPLNRTGANTFHDVQARWNTPWNGQVAVGANNVFGHVGPTLYSQPNSNFPYYGGFDIGRFWYASYSQKF